MRGIHPEMFSCRGALSDFRYILLPHPPLMDLPKTLRISARLLPVRRAFGRMCFHLFQQLHQSDFFEEHSKQMHMVGITPYFYRLAITFFTNTSQISM